MYDVIYTRRFKKKRKKLLHSGSYDDTVLRFIIRGADFLAALPR